MFLEFQAVPISYHVDIIECRLRIDPNMCSQTRNPGLIAILTPILDNNLPVSIHVGLHPTMATTPLGAARAPREVQDGVSGWELDYSVLTRRNPML
jgi:hypothetical protein